MTGMVKIPKAMVAFMPTVWVVLCLLSAAWSESDLQIEHGPIKIWGAHEFGMLEGLLLHEDDGKHSNVWLDNFGAAFSKAC